jgi:GNAT superfamily N-acetyltransferase
MVRLLTQADKQKIFEYLGRNEIETTFLYSNILEFGVENNKEVRRCADYYGFFIDDELKGILPFYNLGSCIPHFEVDEAVPCFAELMKDRKFDYLLGMQKIIKPLYEAVKANKETKQYDESSYFINKCFRPFKLDGIDFIDAGGANNDKVVDFIIGARAKGFSQTVTADEIRKTLAQRGAEEDFLVAEKDGKLVAQACIQTYTPQIIQIGSVYTLEEERGKGYCKAIVSELCTRIAARGKLPTLSVKKKNVPAVKAYTALGFEPYDDYLIIQF